MKHRFTIISVFFIALLVPAFALAAGTNLVTNGNFETAGPAGWAGDHWGTLTATFTYPAPGDGGGSAAKVTLTKYTSGDAKWYMNAVPVTAGTTYTISDNYLSTVATEVDMEYDTAGGVASYAQIALPASSGGAWATFSAQITPPAGTASMRMLHLIDKVGSLTIDNVSITSGASSPPPTKPVITSFAANPASITAGQSATLSWNVTGASSTSISPTIGTVVGTSVAVSPAATTVYTLTATNPQGSVSTTTTVTVTPQPTLPVISSFNANPVTIQQGQSAMLSWSETGATLLTIDQGVGTVTGTSKSVSPTATTTYTLSAGNAAGTTTATAVVDVIVSPLPPTKPAIASFSANPVTIQQGQSAMLSWSETGATLLTIDQGVGTVTGTSKSVSPTATTTYTLSAGNAAGTTTASTVVNVIVPQTPPPTNLIANGNFASGSANNPTGWNADYYGSLKTKFTYPVAGPSGGKAAQVTVSSYKNGDADWDPNLITVTPGALYTFSDTYEATVASEIDVEYVVKKANNMPNECSADSNAAYVDCYEVIAATLPAAANFTTFSSTISPPPGTVSMTVLHLLDQNGSLTLGSELLTAGAASGEAYPQGIVSLTFDDGYLDHYQNALPILESAPGGALHGTFYMIPDDTIDKTQTAYMTIAQMLTMQADGNDMASAHRRPLRFGRAL